ncbi:MAG: ABC transporter substrate-binding protein [Oscillospiraceae bacterium]
MRLKKFGSLLLTATLSFSVAACSAAQPASSAATASSAASSTAAPAGQEYPIVIQHAFGETVINEKPERVATIAWANQDTPLALGVMPVGFSMANFGPVDEYGMHSWTAAKVAELGVSAPNVFQDTDGLDYEAISDAQPDVILAAYSGLTQEEYDLLSEIAPVVAYPRAPWQTYWREQIVLNATGMGMKAEGEQYVAEMEELIASTTAEYPQLEGKNGAFLWIDATDLSTFYLYFTIDTRAAYLTDLGIAFPEELNELKTDDTSFAVSVSTENIDILNNLDIIVAYGDATLLETLQADPLFGTVPAIQRGSVVLIDSNTDLAGAATPSALSIPAIIGEYVALLAEAADKV